MCFYFIFLLCVTSVHTSWTLMAGWWKFPAVQAKLVQHGKASWSFPLRERRILIIECLLYSFKRSRYWPYPDRQIQSCYRTCFFVCHLVFFSAIFCIYFNAIVLLCRCIWVQKWFCVEDITPRRIYTPWAPPSFTCRQAAPLGSADTHAPPTHPTYIL